MTIPVSGSISDRVITIPVTSLATSYYAPVPVNGRVKSVAATLGAALTTADETFTVSYAPPGSTTYTAVTGGAVTLATASSAAGDTQLGEVNPSTTASVTKGGSLKLAASGGGGGAVPVIVTITIGN